MTPMEDIPFNHIAVEGMMKSGKRRLVQALSQEIGGKAVFDQEDNPYLRNFYEES